MEVNRESSTQANNEVQKSKEAVNITTEQPAIDKLNVLGLRHAVDEQATEPRRDLCEREQDKQAQVHNMLKVGPILYENM